MLKQPPPLKGIRVIDYSHFLAGPYVSRCLAALGAEVIKVERPKAGDAGRNHPYFIKGHSGYFLQQNMGKKGLCVNAKDPRGLEFIKKLTKTADVFIENYRPGALKKLGLGYDTLAEENPGLIYCSISAYGQTGPDSERAGFGLIAEAKSGAMDLIGQPNDVPPLMRMPVADMYAGSHGVSAVCAALFSRHTTGIGQHIDIALYDCMVSMHDFAVQFHTLSDGTDVVKRSGNHLPQSTLYGVFPASDGAIVIAAQVNEVWQQLAHLIGGEELANDTRFQTAENRNTNSQAAVDLVKSWAKHRTVANCIELLEKANVPNAPVQTIKQVLADPQIHARRMIIEQEHPELGTILMPNVPFNFSNIEPQRLDIAPNLGQHNQDIAESIGYTDEEIKALENDGVLYQVPLKDETN
ncbi:CaiB/BaiF CoA transferase family protein [Vibrio rhizosphaerae]|uniref:CaiB/BaiF CoA transferase family protein n=1 Tax=Vibrio rhizosphaerae TaxID=398736 RepID=UPI000571BAF8|nr:CoA transferase [Vibrio rhizosphaerae]